MPEITTLPDALARIAYLESELAKATRPKRPAVRKSQTEPCQWCGDTKTVKSVSLGAPLCRDWKPCASRIRRRQVTGNLFYAADKRYRVRDEGHGRWVARFRGETIALADSQHASRRLAYEHFLSAESNELAA